MYAQTKLITVVFFHVLLNFCLHSNFLWKQLIKRLSLLSLNYDYLQNKMFVLLFIFQTLLVVLRDRPSTCTHVFEFTVSSSEILGDNDELLIWNHTLFQLQLTYNYTWTN